MGTLHDTIKHAAPTVSSSGPKTLGHFSTPAPHSSCTTCFCQYKEATCWSERYKNIGLPESYRLDDGKREIYADIGVGY